MSDPLALAEVYRGYIACLNRQDWDNLAHFVGDEVERNGRKLGLSGYRRMLVQDYLDIPDLSFNIALLASSPPLIAARLDFDCTPRAGFLGLDVKGRKVSFSENVFYEFKEGRIASVWSVVDTRAIEAQIR